MPSDCSHLLADLGWVLQCEVLHRRQSSRCGKLAQVHQVRRLSGPAQPRCMPGRWPGMCSRFSFFLWEHWSSSEARGIKATVSCSSPSWLACWRGEVPHTDVGDAEQNPLQGYCLGVVYSLCAGLHPKWSSFLTAIEWFGNPTFLCLLPFTVFSTITVDLFMECTELIKNV